MAAPPEPAGDPMLDFAFETAQRSVAEQRGRLENVRARAATLLSAAAIATSFLGAEALKDVRAGEGASPVADRSLQVWEAVGIASFLGVLVTCLLVVRPWKGWIFGLRGKDLLAHYVGRDAAEGKRALIGHLETHYAKNEPKLRWMYLAFQLGGALLGIEVMAWLIDLTRGGRS